MVNALIVRRPNADLSEDVSRGTICPDVNGLPAVLNRKSSGVIAAYAQLHDLSIIVPTATKVRAA